MSASRKKCPLCTRKLVEVNGVPTCPDCGYREPQSAESSVTDIPKEPVKKKDSKSPAGKVFGALAAVAASCVIGIVVSLAKSGLSDALDAAIDRMESSLDKESVTVGQDSDSAVERSSTDIDGKAGTGSKVQTYSLPQSDFLIALVENLFEKPVNQVSPEELGSIAYLDIYYLDDTDVMVADVMLSDGTEESYVLSDFYVDTADFACLEGLEYLYLEAGSMSFSTDWHKLKKLQFLMCDASMADVADYMDASQLVYLSTDDTFGMQNLSVISEFPNLEYLELNAAGLSDIEGISGADSLKTLKITNGDMITDFSELYEMPWLEELSIQSGGLKDIGFISGMEQLRCLSLEGTEVKKIDALTDCADTLTMLCLEDNYQIEDISPVLECTGLEVLQLWVDYQFDIPMEAPDFSAMRNLKSLSIDGYDRFSRLALLTGLTELTIECPGSGDGEFLKSLTNLKTLNLVNMSVYEGFLENVNCLENLEILNLEDSFIWCDISHVLELPKLRELNLEWAECGLCPDKLTVSESLESLNLAHATFDSLLEDGSWDYGSYDKELSMQEVLDALAPCVPGLRELYVPEHELEDVAFAKNLSRLVLLDISDNYITDISPLVKLEQLTVLICEDNPVQSTDGLEEVIIVR